MRKVIAIDGPAGAGKSTVAKLLAKELGILYLDTGAMYRALGLKALRAGIDIASEEEVRPLLDATDVTVENDAGTQKTFLDGEDVSSLIRTEKVSRAASDISKIPAVRIKLAELQRNVARTSEVVMEGREIGSFVVPDAPYKFFVTASSGIRAERRLRELIEKGNHNGETLESLKADIESRDYNDSHRAFAPLVRVADAILIDTTDMTIDGALEAVLSHIQGDR